MKTIFDAAGHDELIERLGKLASDSSREWGKMSPSQMMEHTARVLEMAMCDEQPIKQKLIGKALGWAFKKSFVGEKPFAKNAPTGPEYVIKDEPDFEATRARLSELIAALHGRGPETLDGNVHPFFGRLTGKQWGETQYKHVDHHLRQFGV
jgi:Protein of unknown function (DUF1569)